MFFHHPLDLSGMGMKYLGCSFVLNWSWMQGAGMATVMGTKVMRTAVKCRGRRVWVQLSHC